MFKDKLRAGFLELKKGEIGPLLSAADDNPENKRFFYVFSDLFENDILALNEMSKLAVENPKKINIQFSFFLLLLKHKRLKEAWFCYENMPECYHKKLARKIHSYASKEPFRSAVSKSKCLVKDKINQDFQVAICNQDWLGLFLLCYFLKHDFFVEEVSEYNVGLLYCYSLMRLNLKHALTVEMSSDAMANDSFEWMALKSYLNFFENKHSDNLEMLSAVMPASQGCLDIFYSLAFECYAEATLRTHSQELFDDLLCEEETCNGSQSWLLLYKGLKENVKGNRALADAAWSCAALSNSFSINHSWGVNSYSKMGLFEFSKENIKLHSGGLGRNGCLNVLSCADDTYAKSFSLLMVNNIVNNPGVNWHYHFIIKKDGSLTRFMDFISAFPNVSVSYEFCGVFAPKQYFTMPRFYLAREIISNIDSKLIVADIDMHAKDIDKASKIIDKSEACVGFNYSGFYHHFPWHRVQANISMFKPGRASDQCLSRLIDWLEENYDPSNRYQWWIDQVALDVAVSEIERDCNTLDFSGELLKCFAFAGSSPDRKETYIKSFEAGNESLSTALSLCFK